MAKIKIESKQIEMLDFFNIEYTIKNSDLGLKEFDSLHITLGGKWADSWKRWSNGDKGRNAIDLAKYLYQQGLITDKERFNKWMSLNNKGNSFESTDSKDRKTTNHTSKTYTIEKVEDYDFRTMVTNPDTEIIENYLIGKRKLSPAIVKRAIELGVLVQDGRNNARFLWLDRKHSVIGADVQGTVYNKEKFSRGTLKMILPGSKGFFWMVSKDVKRLGDIKRIVLTEAPIDTLSFVELSIKPKEIKENSKFIFPDSQKGTLYISMSGAETKIESTLSSLKQYFKFDINKISKLDEVIVATDNDEVGNSVFNILRNKFKLDNLKREIPNDGLEFDNKIIKDWNEMLQLFKKNFK